MKLRYSRAAMVGAGACLTLALLPATASAKPEPPGASPGVSDEVKRIDASYMPLRRIANAIDAAGRGSSADVYSGLFLNGSNGAVDLWLTDIGQLGRVIAQAKQRDATADYRRVKVHKGAFSRATLNTVRDQLLSADESHALPYRVFSGFVDYDGSGIHAGVSNVAAAQAHEPARKRALHAMLQAQAVKTAADAVPISFFKGTSATAMYNKWDDTSNQIGGDQLTPPGGGWCTAGFAADDSAGNNYLITAGHCGAGTYKSGWGSVVVGTTAMGPYDRFDSVAIKGGRFYNDEGEANPNQHYEVLSGGHAYSYNGDVVCQNGVSTAWRQGETPCNITVRNENAWWYIQKDDGTWMHVQGVIGTRPYDQNHPAVIAGDSGATVFTYNDGNRQLRGIVESANPCADLSGGGCQHYGSGTRFVVTMPNGTGAWASDTIGWVEATDILGHFGLTQDTKP